VMIRYLARIERDNTAAGNNQTIHIQAAPIVHPFVNVESFGIFFVDVDPAKRRMRSYQNGSLGCVAPSPPPITAPAGRPALKILLVMEDG
jgi:hypothetical protein